MTIKNRLKTILKEEYIEEFKEINDFLFDNPELGNEEYITSEYLVNYLRKNGFKMTYPYCNVETAFKGEYIRDEKLPTVAFLAEYDALPGYGIDKKPAHACGHNWIGATSLGAGVLLSKMSDILKCNIIVIGTPAEETTGEKCTLIENRVFDSIDIVFQCHIGEKTTINQGTLAIDCLEFNFKGKAAHAACFPQNGVNALDGVNLMFAGVNALRQHVLSDVRIHGIITEGGVAPNITPENSSCKFYIRAKDREYLNSVTEKVINCGKGAELMTGAKVTYKKFENSFDNIKYISILQEIMINNLKEVGINNIKDSCSDSAGSTDMGNVSQICPTMYTEISLDLPEKALVHEEKILKYLKSNYAYDKLEKSILAMCYSVIDIIENKEILNRIEEEFEKGIF